MSHSNRKKKKHILGLLLNRFKPKHNNIKSVDDLHERPSNKK